MSSGSHFFRAESNLAAEEARKRKAERTRHLGEPLDLPAKPLDILVKGNDLWLAQSDAVIRRVNLESGASLQVYKGHTAPMTTIAILEDFSDKDTSPLLVSGSWDKTVKLWNTKDKTVLSSTEAHSDFVKRVFIVPELKLLITSGADKVVRFWDLSDPYSKESLKNVGVISAHSRPVQCIAVDVHSASAATLYTADSMGIIKIWELGRTYGDSPNCRAIEKEQLNVHRTGINDMWFGQNQLWTASSDETALLTERGHTATMPTPVKHVSPIVHGTAVNALLPLSLTEIDEPYLLTAAGDAIHLYDVTEPGNPELLSTTDAHWLDVTALRLWFRRRTIENGKISVEPWIVSASLDQTIRRWRLADLISPPKEAPKHEPKEEHKPVFAGGQLTAEEEAELAELLSDDD